MKASFASEASPHSAEVHSAHLTMAPATTENLEDLRDAQAANALSAVVPPVEVQDAAASPLAFVNELPGATPDLPPIADANIAAPEAAEKPDFKWYQILGRIPTMLVVKRQIARERRGQTLRQRYEENPTWARRALVVADTALTSGLALAAAYGASKLIGVGMGLGHHDSGVAADNIHAQAGNQAGAHNALLTNVVLDGDTPPNPGDTVDLNGFDASHLPHDQLSTDQQQWLGEHHSEGPLGAYDAHSGDAIMGQHGTMTNEAMKSLVDAGYDPSQMTEHERGEYVQYILKLNHMSPGQAAHAYDNFVPEMPSNGGIFEQVTRITAGREGGPLMPNPNSDFAHHLLDIKNTVEHGGAQTNHTGGGTGSTAGHPGSNNSGATGAGNGTTGGSYSDNPTGAPAAPGITPAAPDVPSAGSPHSGHIDGHPGPNGHIDGHPDAPAPRSYIDGATTTYGQPHHFDPYSLPGAIEAAEKGFRELSQPTPPHILEVLATTGTVVAVEQYWPEVRAYLEARRDANQATYDEKQNRGKQAKIVGDIAAAATAATRATMHHRAAQRAAEASRQQSTLPTSKELDDEPVASPNPGRGKRAPKPEARTFERGGKQYTSTVTPVKKPLVEGKRYRVDKNGTMTERNATTDTAENAAIHERLKR